ncbi:MAG TPA: hypothetical protein PK677_09385 [Acidiphilium sp.]|nr:MAG: hypothetical protein B7Z67_10125 [Acidiphilium sp. 21-60-14]OYV89583.1 MAG: hypothetical protein B7Z57_12295 [Acidiphilium sp. 37-60-79]OZB39131.1 MAG: hypothetical protein B7X48_10385 [Acidiphilium sp. 34-60-192]HQT88750.1 hypothetical protein [Acidiphilium sp.]HQU23899.1 hypothetical protein [Acidiphilium sp.]
MLSQPDIWCRPPAERFAAIIALLRQLIGPLGHRRVNPLLNITIYARLGFLLRRFAQILARPTPPKPRIRPHTPQSQAAKPAPPVPRDKQRENARQST